MDSTRKGIWLTVALCLVAIVVVVLALANRLHQEKKLSPAELREDYGAIVLDTPRRFSDFELRDHHGNKFDRQDLEGKWTLMFAGFTHCPDICPTTMAVLGRMADSLPEREREDVQVVLLTVDPERDTEEKLAEYVPYFHPDFVGVTGSEHQILSLATQLNVVYSQVPLGEDDYTVDHTTHIVLINPRGDYHGYFRAPFEESRLRHAWRAIKDGFSG